MGPVRLRVGMISCALVPAGASTFVAQSPELIRPGLFELVRVPEITKKASCSLVLRQYKCCRRTRPVLRRCRLAPIACEPEHDILLRRACSRRLPAVGGPCARGAARSGGGRKGAATRLDPLSARTNVGCVHRGLPRVLFTMICVPNLSASLAECRFRTNVGRAGPGPSKLFCDRAGEICIVAIELAVFSTQP